MKDCKERKTGDVRRRIALVEQGDKKTTIWQWYEEVSNVRPPA